MTTSAPPLARYPVRTPLAYWAVVATLVPLSGAVVWVCLPLFTRGHLSMLGGYSFLILVIAAAMVVLPFVYYGSTKAYRASGEIRLYPDRLEIPGASSPLPLASLAIARRELLVRYHMFGIPVGEVSRGIIATFTSGDARRELSDRVFPDPRHMHALLIDLDLVARGLPPGGPRFVAITAEESAPTGVPADLKAYESKLDEELDDLD